MIFKIESNTFNKMNAYVQATDTEIGGLFSVKKTEDASEFIVDDVYLLKQKVSGASVDFEGEDLSELIEKLAVEDKLDTLRGSWHSHPKFSVFFSETDKSAIRKYRDNNPNLPWLASMVLNQKGDIEARLDVFDSSAAEHIVFEDIDTVVLPSKNVQKKADEEVKEIVKEKKWSWTKKDDDDKKDRHWKSATNNGDTAEEDKELSIEELRKMPVHDLTDEQWDRLVEADYPEGPGFVHGGGSF